MKPGLPFATLLEIATGERDDCARRIAEATEARKRAADRLAMLDTHRASCEMDDPAVPLDGAQLRDKRAFLARLEIAITRQAEELRACEQRELHARGQLQEAETRLKAFGNLKVRADRAENTVLQRREQNLMDEFAARRLRPAR